MSDVFYGAQFQRGHGLGSLLKGLFRWAAPFIKSGAKHIGKEAMRASSNVLGDVMKGVNIKEAAKSRYTEGARNLLEQGADRIEQQQYGEGYKRKPRKRTRHANTVSGRAKRAKKSRSSKGQRLKKKKKKKKATGRGRVAKTAKTRSRRRRRRPAVTGGKQKKRKTSVASRRSKSVKTRRRRRTAIVTPKDVFSTFPFSGGHKK